MVRLKLDRDLHAYIGRLYWMLQKLDIKVPSEMRMVSWTSKFQERMYKANSRREVKRYEQEIKSLKTK